MLTFLQDYWTFLSHPVCFIHDFIFMNGWVKDILWPSVGYVSISKPGNWLETDFLFSCHIHHHCLPKDASQLFPTENSVRARIFRTANSLARIPCKPCKWPTDAADARDRTNCPSRVFFSLGGIQKLNHICKGSFWKPHRCCIMNILSVRKLNEDGC